MRGLVALIAAISLSPIPAHAQTPGSAFEVASIKSNKSGPQAVQRVSMQAGDRVSMTNVPLRTLVQVAYPGMSDITGGPHWMGVAGPNLDADRFDLVAKAEAPATLAQLQGMLQTLLADRFKLVVHTQTKRVPVYALVLARADGRLGPNLDAAAADCASLRARPDAPRDPCGIGTLANSAFGRLSVHGMTMKDLAQAVQRDVGRKTVDKTDLTGFFDFDLKWTPQIFLQDRSAAGNFPSQAIDPDGPSIFIALQEQLGLKLDSQQGEVTVLVIDHVEHPTEN